MVAVVGTLAVVEVHVVTAEFQGRKHLLVASGQLPCSLSRSLLPSCRKTRSGFFSAFADHARIGVAAANVREAADMCESTLRNASGRCQATVNAQMPPLDMPQIAWPSGSSVNGCSLRTSGRISVSKNFA